MKNLFLSLTLSIITLFGCGSEMHTASNDTGDTGSAAFSLKWDTPNNIPSPLVGEGKSLPPKYLSGGEGGFSYAPIDCTAIGVSTVSANVYDSGGTYITNGGPWNCADHSGTITGISAGINRMITVNGKDSSGRIIYNGQITGVTINKDQTTDAGQITMTYVANDTTAPTDGTLSASAGSSQVSLSWSGFSDSGSGLGSYKLVYSTTSTPSSCSAGTQIFTGTGTSYTHTGLTNGTTYYYRICATDNAGNISNGATANAAPVSGGTTGSAPSAPTGVLATAGSSQVSISWSSISGATSYNIYWSTTSGVTKTTGTKLTGATSSYTHSGLTNGTTYYYVVTAVNSYGESSESSQVSATPATTTTPTTVTKVSGGSYHTIALKSDGTVWAWGDNFRGQLGDGTTTDRSTPVQVSGLTGVIAIAAGSYHTIALKSDGTVWAWGYNGSGQLGDGTTTDRSTPVQVSGLTGVIAIAGGSYHTIALKSGGTVWAWGWNGSGQLGDGTTTNKSLPVQVGVIAGVSAIDAGGTPSYGESHTVALQNDGTVWAWGYNVNGQLGDGTTTNRSLPVQVSGLTGVSAIKAGWKHTVALKNDGTVWNWGDNNGGELGNGTITNSSTPIQVTSLTGVYSAISAGMAYTIALKNDGVIWGWGSSEFGQLGQNAIGGYSLTPIQVSGLTGVTAISGEGWHTIALKNDGTVWALGYNNNGQLGDGTTTNRTTPVQVSGL